MVQMHQVGRSGGRQLGELTAPDLMLLRVLAAFVVLAACAQAQEGPRPTAGDRVVLVVGATAGVLTVPVLGPFAVLTVAAATYGTSASLGLDPTLGGVALDTVIGMGIGTGVGYAMYGYLTLVEGYDADLSVSLGSLFVGLVSGAVATGVVHGIRVEPVSVAAPTGERTTGISLRVAL